jgi:hypothetical protein
MGPLNEENAFSSIDKAPLHKNDRIIALSLGLLILLLGCPLIVKGVAGIYHDDGIYIITAQAIAQGDGYRQIHLPDSPLQTKYPCLYPLLLSIIWKICPSFPDNLLWMQWMSLVMGAILLALSYLFFVRFAYFSRAVSAAALLLCATSPYFLFFCTSCLSEIPFALFLVISMWALELHLEKPSTSRMRQLCIGILLALPFLCRTIGVVSLLGVLILAVRQRKGVWFTSLGAALIIVPSAFWMLFFAKWVSATSSNTYYTNYLSWWTSYGIPHLSRIIASNARDICFGATPISLVDKTFLSKWILNGSALVGFFGLAAFISGIKRLKVLPIFLVAYLLVVLVWPWPPARFLIPVAPILFAAVIAAALGFLTRLGCPFKYRNRIALIPLVALLVANAIVINRDIGMVRATGYPARLIESGDVPVHWSSYRDFFDWIKRNTGQKDVFVAGMDPMIYLYTGRPSFRPFVARPSSMFYGDRSPEFGSLGDVMMNLKLYEPCYLALFPSPGFAEQSPYVEFVMNSRKEYPGWLECVYMGTDRRFTIWKVNMEGLPKQLRTAPSNRIHSPQI